MPLSPIDPKNQKATLRKAFLQQRSEMVEDEHTRVSEALVAALAKHPDFLKAQTILLYYPIRKELSILPLAEKAFSLGKAVAFPISDPKTCTLSFHRVSSLSELSEGTYGIPEPRLDAPVFDNNSLTLCVVPALSFDRCGYRLGYGKGYYDRFLTTFRGKSVGLVPSSFLSDSLPHDNYDKRVDLIFTERGELIPDEPTESEETTDSLLQAEEQENRL